MALVFRGWGFSSFAAMLAILSCAATPPTTGAQVSGCEPMPGFDQCMRVHVDIESTAEAAFAVVTDIERNSEFFPELEFRFEPERPIATGDVYYSRRAGARRWSTYRFVAVEPYVHMSGELLERGYPFRAFRYDHRFLEIEGGVRSEERLDYSLRPGVPRRMAERKIRGALVAAHLQLKRTLETNSAR